MLHWIWIATFWIVVIALYAKWVSLPKADRLTPFMDWLILTMPLNVVKFTARAFVWTLIIGATLAVAGFIVAGIVGLLLFGVRQLSN